MATLAALTPYAQLEDELVMDNMPDDGDSSDNNNSEGSEVSKKVHCLPVCIARLLGNCLYSPFPPDLLTCMCSPTVRYNNVMAVPELMAGLAMQEETKSTAALHALSELPNVAAPAVPRVVEMLSQQMPNSSRNGDIPCLTPCLTLLQVSCAHGLLP